MKRAPRIGEKVQYYSTYLMEYEHRPRTCTGVVTKLYQKHDDVFDDDGDFVRRGPLLPPSRWHAVVQVDERPDWWGYPDSDVFAPCVEELFPIHDPK